MSNSDVWNTNMINDFKKLNNTLDVYDIWLNKYKEYIDSAKKTIVDLGCGIGNDTMFIKSCGKEVLSVDYSEEALRIIDENIENSNTLKMDFEKEWLLDNESADLIIANLSLHYFNTETTFKIINNIKDTLVDGGVLIVRLNSINDKNYGSNSLNEIESHYYETMNIRKRFFDRNDIDYFFSSDNKEYLDYIKYFNSRNTSANFSTSALFTKNSIPNFLHVFSTNSSSSVESFLIK